MAAYISSGVSLQVTVAPKRDGAERWREERDGILDGGVEKRALGELLREHRMRLGGGWVRNKNTFLVQSQRGWRKRWGDGVTGRK